MPIPLGILAVAGAGAGAAGAFDLLETTLISTNTASVTFSNLNNYSDYKHLQIRGTLRTQAVTGDQWTLRFNSDSGSNYRSHSLFGDGGGVSSVDSGSSTYIVSYTNAAPGNTDPAAGIFSAYVIDLLDFSNSSKNTTIRALNGQRGHNSRIGLTSGFWNNTAAVTSITLSTVAGGFVSGTRLSLYGVK